MKVRATVLHSRTLMSTSLDKSLSTLGFLNASYRSSTPILEDTSQNSFFIQVFATITTAYPRLANRVGHVHEESKAKAGAESKHVLIRVGTPYCGWCNVLAQFVQDHAQSFETDYVDIKIDTLRMLNAEPALSQFESKKSGGVEPTRISKSPLADSTVFVLIKKAYGAEAQLRT